MGLGLNTADAWALYRLAYFPRVPAARKEETLSDPRLTPAGVRIGRYIVTGAAADLTEDERRLGDRYLKAAWTDRLSLPGRRHLTDFR